MSEFLRTSQQGTLSTLGSLLRDAGYTEAGLGEALGLEEGSDVASTEQELAHFRLQTDDPRLETLARLFLIGQPVRSVEIERLVTPIAVDELGEIGLLEAREDEVVASVGITPWRGLLVVSDWQRLERAQNDHVPPISPSARALAALTPRTDVESALDVGSGCGVQALLAARHAGRVVATDINARAVRFTAMSAALTGVDNVEVRQGSLFEPVAGQRFDLVVCNPPYVISPDNDFAYRDGGEPRDTLARSLVMGLGTHLREGGFGTVMANWIHAPDDWTEAPRQWVENTGCDAWILRFSSQDPVAYAGLWNESILVEEGADRHAETVESWLAYYRRECIERIGGGAVIVRRREGENWVRADDAANVSGAEAGPQILRFFDAQDRINAMDAETELLGAVLELVDGHRLDQTLRFKRDHYEAPSVTLSFEDSGAVAGTLPAGALAMLFLFDGERTLEGVIEQTIAQVGGGTTEERFRLLRTARELYALGFLVSRDG